MVGDIGVLSAVDSVRVPTKNMKKAQDIISPYPLQHKKAAVIPLLDLGQRQNDGRTSISVMRYVAKLVEVPPM